MKSTQAPIPNPKKEPDLAQCVRQFFGEALVSEDKWFDVRSNEEVSPGLILPNPLLQ